MNVLGGNQWSEGFAKLAEGLPRPRAILAVSAHWFVDGIFVTRDERPATIHDFSGFPRALYEIEYPAPGSVDLAKRVSALLAESGAGLSSEWGLDHGTWTVLRWMYPAADIPCCSSASIVVSTRAVTSSWAGRSVRSVMKAFSCSAAATSSTTCGTR